MDATARRAIIHLVNTLAGGGTERMLIALLQRMDPSRARHVVVCLRDAGELASRLPGHVACVPLGVRGPRGAGRKLARVLRDWDAKLLHARNTGTWADAIRATMMRATPLVLGFHGLEHNGGFTLRQRMAVRVAVRMEASFACVSHSGADKLLDEVGIPPERIALLPNGLDLKRFSENTAQRRAIARAAFGFTDEEQVIGIVGSLTPVKGHLALIDAFAGVHRDRPQARLLIVGDGPLREAVESSARAYGLEDVVVLAGWREDVPDLLPACDLYVCSSESEGMNNALLEAMATGLPCLATEVGDNGFLLRQGEAGVLLPPGRPQQWVEPIFHVLDDPGLASRLGVAAARRAEAFSLDAAAARYEAFYDRLLDRGRSHGAETGELDHQVATVIGR